MINTTRLNNWRKNLHRNSTMLKVSSTHLSLPLLFSSPPLPCSCFPHLTVLSADPRANNAPLDVLNYSHRAHCIMSEEAPAPANPTVFLYTSGATVPRDVTNVKIDPSVVDIPSYAFSHWKELVEVEFCEGLQTIGQSAFKCCRSLKSIHVPFTVKVISLEAFAQCDSSTKIELCKGLQAIGELAFKCCRTLKSIRIPFTVKVISRGAFAHCDSLAEVELCEGLQRIGTLAFNSCSSFLLPLS